MHQVFDDVFTSTRSLDEDAIQSLFTLASTTDKALAEMSNYEKNNSMLIDFKKAKDLRNCSLINFDEVINLLVKVILLFINEIIMILDLNLNRLKNWNSK